MSFGISEAAIELEDSRSTLGEHDPCIQDATEFGIVVAQRGQRRMNDIVMDLYEKCLRGE